MAWRDWGNQPIQSTGSNPVANPSTSTLIAEIDSTQLGTASFAPSQHKNLQVTWLVGADTNATWQLEVAGSTSLTAGPSTSVDMLWVKTPSGQSGQYVTTHKVGPKARVRARVNSTFTGSAVASIIAEYLT